jgi:hypothetical protein
MVAQMSGHHMLGGGTEERLMLRQRNRINEGDLGLTNEVDDWLGESAQKDVDDSFLEGNEIVHIHDIRDDDCENGDGESSEDREKIGPR